MKQLALTTAIAASLLTGNALAATIDGALGSDPYGAPLFVQDSSTSFGDNTDGSSLFANGSEIDSVYGEISSGNLNLLVAGNLETNFNRLVLFFDTGAGGQNTLDGSTGGPFPSFSGTVFDAGFDADYALLFNGGNAGPEYFLDFAAIGGASSFLGGSGSGNQILNGSNGIIVGFDQSNVAGVTSSSAAGAAGVTTGFEFQIPLSVIGSPTGSIDVAGFIAGSGGGFVSSQVIGGGFGVVSDNSNHAGNSPDFTQVAGNQFVTVNAVVPEPMSATLALATLALSAGVRRRKD
ncbi:MAG: hypothetical protein AAF589_04115 [Planctomycetota bacterium]